MPLGAGQGLCPVTLRMMGSGGCGSGVREGDLIGLCLGLAHPPLPRPLIACPTGRPEWAGDRRARVGSFPQGLSEQDPEQAVAVPRSQRRAATPNPLGPSVIRAIFRPLFLPISGLWTGPESGLSWGRGLEPLNWAAAWELQPQPRAQPQAGSWQGCGGDGGGKPGRGQDWGWRSVLAPLTPSWGPLSICPMLAADHSSRRGLGKGGRGQPGHGQDRSGGVSQLY